MTGSMTGPMPALEATFRGTVGTFRLEAQIAVDGIGLTGVFGPSGCGKTTLLRCISGLQRLSGRLSVNGDVWQDDERGIFKKPHQRSVGYVFQDSSLFPHLNVAKNLAFGTGRAQRIGGAVSFRFDDIVDLLGLHSLLARSPVALSGGERQRVAIGRALLSQPRLLLFDEPLSALDRSMKEDIFPYLETLHAVLAIPCLYVSHDMAELERLADTLIVMSRGRVQACGPMAALEADPSLPLMRAPDAAVTLSGHVVETDEAFGLAHIAVSGGTLVVAAPQVRADDMQRLRIKASDVSFTRVQPEQTSILNCLRARIVSIHPHSVDGAHVNVVASLGDDGAGAQLIGRVTRKSCEMLGLMPGVRVFVQIKSVALLASRGLGHISGY